MNKNAITLLEVLVVIIIIAILASIAIPNFIGKIERTRGERAIANIELITSAIKMYHVKYEGYPVMAGIDTLTEINTTFNLELVDNYFDYTLGGMLPAYDIDWHIIAERNTNGPDLYEGLQLIYESLPSTSSTPGERWAPASNWPWTPQN